MVNAGEEPTGSMGIDAALPVLSNKNRSFYDYFQQFVCAGDQSAIDPIREEIVMSLTSFIGPSPICSVSTRPIRRCVWKCISPCFER